MLGKTLSRKLCTDFTSLCKKHRFLARSLASFSAKKGTKMANLIAVCQMNSTSDKEKNLRTCEELIEKSSARGAKVVFLPECFDFVGESKEKTFSLSEPLDGPTITRMRAVAKQHNVWLSLGGFHQRGPAGDEKRILNSHVLVNNTGDITSVYNKTHMFDVDIKGGSRLQESDVTIPGTAIVPPVDTPVGQVGLAICYDLRFPELSGILTRQGADILTFPSAFTEYTGMAHWEVLLRARAIENQCYIAAAAQTGQHNNKRRSYGHAMIVDPWGCVIAQCHEGVDVCFAEIDHKYKDRVRESMPVQQHRRTDLY